MFISGKKLQRNRLSLFLVIAMLFMLLAPAAAAMKPVDTQFMLIGFNSIPGVAEHGLLRAYGVTIEKEYTLIPVMLVEVPLQAIPGLQRNPLVKYLEEDMPVYAVTDSIPWGIERVKAPDVWTSALTITGAGIKVAVLDTGIGPHPDLNVKGGTTTVGGKNYSDGNGHGTHVAGTIAALKNDIGVVGVAPAAELYAVKVLNNGGSGSVSSIIAGIEWSVNNEMDIINMSLGSSEPSQALEDACKAAFNTGIFLVAAAGNSGNADGTGDNVIYPAKYWSVLGVAATDTDNNRAAFSSTGLSVDLAAPGVNIYSTYKNGYAYLSGTSMASPHVAGVAALVLSAKPSLGSGDVSYFLKSTAQDLGLPKAHQGHGLVNALAAVNEVLALPEDELFPVTGYVKDENGVCIPNAAVAVGGTSLKAETDGEGFYTLQLSEGVYTLTASAPGYESQMREQVLVHTPTTVDFVLTHNELASMINDIDFTFKNYGRFTDLSVTIHVSSAGVPVAGVTVELLLNRTEGGSWSQSGITDNAGNVTLTVKKASSGTYTATVQSVRHEMYYWDQAGSTTEKQFVF